MNIRPPVYRSDIKPLEFILAVTVGGIGSAILSAIKVNPLISVGFALLVMFILAFLRWRIATEFKDHQSMEAFAEDIYLLGYLLTLSSFLGLAPRLMSDESNLFHIAGMKLVTTVVGLGMMMIFRQVARRWAELETTTADNQMVEQQKKFSDAVARLNDGADALTTKLDEVVRRFDPEYLIPVANWSHRAAQSFQQATESLENIHAVISKSFVSFQSLNASLEQARNSSLRLSQVMQDDTARAAGNLAVELAGAAKVTGNFNLQINQLPLASKDAQDALMRLATQANFGVAQFQEITQNLKLLVAEFAKLDLFLKNISAMNSSDINSPFKRLIDALNSASAITQTTFSKFDVVGSELLQIREFGEKFATTINSDLTQTLKSSSTASEQLRNQMNQTDQKLVQLSSGLDNLGGYSKAGIELIPKMLTEISALQAELKNVVEQLKLSTPPASLPPEAENTPGIVGALEDGGR